jgi:DNA-binding NarL/FixJ family response regulator
MDEATPYIRILIVAQAPALRAGLRALLSGPGTQVVREAAALTPGVADRHALDVVVLGDAGLLGGLGRVADEEARIGAVVLSDDDRTVAMLRALPLGGWAVLPSEASPSELQAATLAVAQGLVVLAPAMATRLSQRTAEPITEIASEALTPRELEVLQLMSQGLPNKQIARALSISEHTVKFHISSIFAKLGAASRTDAVSRGARQGLITL